MSLEFSLKDELYNVVKSALISSKSNEDEAELISLIEACIQRGDFISGGEFDVDGIFSSVNVLVGLWITMEFLLTCPSVPDDYNCFVDQIYIFTKDEKIRKGFYSIMDTSIGKCYNWCVVQSDSLWLREFNWEIDSRGQRVGFALKRLHANWYGNFLTQINVIELIFRHFRACRHIS